MSEYVEPIDKADLLRTIRAERQALEELLARLDPSQMTRPGVVGEWSVKDILVHLVAWEQWMVRRLVQALRGEVPDRPATSDDVDRFNALTFQENRDRPLDEVLADFHRSYREALDAVETTAEEDLFEAGRFPWRQGDPLWIMVAANMSWHYQEHADSIRAWLESSKVA